MSEAHNPRREHPNTYIVQDRSNQQELIRLQIQDELVTGAMGGVLPEQTDPATFRRILDVGCGPGNWLIKVAQQHPIIHQLVGVDVSAMIVDYARAQAVRAEVTDRVEFQTMDALRMLEFPNNTFDLVNVRFASGYVRIQEWLRFISELLRVAAPGGVIRLTESEIDHQCTSQALTQLNRLLLQSLYHAGYFFRPDDDGVTGELAMMLQRHGIQNVQTRLHAMHFPPGSPQAQQFADNERHAYRTIKPFLSKWSRLPDNYEQIYQQALSDMQQPEFEATWRILTAWGTKPA